MPTRAELISGWKADYDLGKFLVPKHDGRDNTYIDWSDPRSVLGVELADNLTGFLFEGGSFDINVYADSRHPRGSGYYEIVPTGLTPFNVPGSGVAPGNTASQASGDYDRLVIVWGSRAGWHCHAQNSGWIQGQVGTRFTVSGVL